MPRILILALFAAVAVAAPAPAATLVGTDPTLSHDASAGCLAPATSCTYSQNQLGGQALVSPVAGVITSWRFKQGPIETVASLRVMRPDGGGSSVRFISSSPAQSMLALNGVRGPFATRQPVQAGDKIGLRLAAPPGGWSNQSSIAAIHNSAGDSFQTWRSPDPADGDVATPKSNNSNYQLLVQAVVEPDADGDGHGDETQDACPHLSGRQACAADLSVAFTGPATGVRGAPLAVRVAVPNRGPDASEPVSLAIALPEGLRLDAVPAGCSAAGSTQVTCALEPVAAAGERAVELALTPLVAGQLALAASASAASTDGDGASGSHVIEAAEPAVVTPPPPPPPPGDTLAPVVSRLRVQRGTVAVFTVSEAGRLALTVQRLVPGRRSGRRCVRGRAKTRAARCARSVRVSSVSFDVRAGTVKRRLKRRGKLRPGRYRVIALARDAAGNRAKPVTKVFVVPRKR